MWFTVNSKRGVRSLAWRDQEGLRGAQEEQEYGFIFVLFLS